MSEENKNQPTYTFWAEHVNPSQTVNSTNSETNSSDKYQTTDTITLSQPVMAQPENIPPFPEISFEPPVKKPKKARRFFGFIGKAAIFGLIASLSYYGTNRLINHLDGDDKGSRSVLNQNSNGRFDLNLDPPSGANIPSTSISTNVNIQSTDISKVVEETMPATVAITSTFNTSSYDVFGYEYGGENTGGGSGIIIGQKDNELFIATNNHVVEGATKIMVTYIDGSQSEAVIRGRNSSADLAVITVDTKTMTSDALAAIKVAKLGNSETVKVGQMAIAIGNALGYGQSVTVGYISAKDRDIAVDQNTNLTVLQTDAAINPGNSGGALININGEVIGINSAKFSDTDVEGMGYSIPISIAYPIVDELMNREILTDEEKGYLGVYPQDVDSSVASLYDWPIGVYVAKLVDGGAAQEAGIYVGDIITAVNNITLSSSDMLRETVNSYRSGTTVTVTLMRFVDGEYIELTLDVVLQKGTE